MTSKKLNVIFRARFFSSRVLTSEKCENLLPKFEAILGSLDYVNVNKSALKQYSHDEGHFLPQLPDVVLMPDRVEQVSQIMKACNEVCIPVVPYGTGTGLEGGVVPVQGGVTLLLERMNQISNFNETDFDCRVGAGVTRKTLNEFLRNTGLCFTVDPGADASICGMLATSASGTTSVRYGTIKNNVKNMEVVLADGTIVHTRGKGRHPCAGYNLTDLFVGSEGTLGVITSATVCLHALPTAVSATVCAFPTLESAKIL